MLMSVIHVANKQVIYYLYCEWFLFNLLILFFSTSHMRKNSILYGNYLLQ